MTALLGGLEWHFLSGTAHAAVLASELAQAVGRVVPYAFTRVN